MTSDPIPQPHFYKVHLTSDQARTLSWLAGRYETAEILMRHAQDRPLTSDPYAAYPPALIRLPEHAAGDYLGALAEENGNPNQMVPTCVGGDLSEKLLTLYLEIAR